VARTIEHAKLESPTARSRLPRGRQPHLQSLVAGRAALGYVRKPDAKSGRWFLRRYIGGKYVVEPLGLADDTSSVQADGVGVLSFEQARETALERLNESAEGKQHGPLTVRRAMARYIDFLAAQGKRTLETERRTAALILPSLGDVEVASLTSDRIRKWLTAMAAAPALLRSKRDAKQRNTKAAPGNDPEAVRRRRSSANRVLTMLKAGLNHAYDEKLVANNEAWGRRVKPFRDVEVARTRYLTIAEAKRLLNACAPDFRELVQAALETGCRYGELCKLEVSDFNPDAGAINIRRSKSGKARHVVLSDEGVAFFAQLTAGRPGNEPMLRNAGRVARALERERERLGREGKLPPPAKVDDTGVWRDAEQGRAMREANERARIAPPISFHGLRHTWASLAAMAGVPLMVIAKNLGHTDTRMVEKHYGHLAPSFVVDAIRAGAPRFGFVADEKIAVLKAR
jgi:integrase